MTEPRPWLELCSEPIRAVPRYAGHQEGTHGRMVPVYKVPAWRVPNEDGCSWPTAILRAPPYPPVTDPDLVQAIAYQLRNPLRDSERLWPLPANSKTDIPRSR